MRKRENTPTRRRRNRATDVRWVVRGVVVPPPDPDDPGRLARAREILETWALRAWRAQLRLIPGPDHPRKPPSPD